jgi:hypothetical protein
MRVLFSWLARRAAAATVAVAVPISRKRCLLVAITYTTTDAIK